MRRGVRGGVGDCLGMYMYKRNILAVTKGGEVRANMCIKSLQGGIDVENRFIN